MGTVIRLLVCAYCSGKVSLTDFKSLECYEYFEQAGMCQNCQDQL